MSTQIHLMWFKVCYDTWRLLLIGMRLSTRGSVFFRRIIRRYLARRQIGDKILGRNGLPCHKWAIFSSQCNRPCWLQYCEPRDQNHHMNTEMNEGKYIFVLNKIGWKELITLLNVKHLLRILCLLCYYGFDAPFRVLNWKMKMKPVTQEQSML